MDSPQTLVQQLNDGTIPRTPFPNHLTGASLSTLAHGDYNVTGGMVSVGNLGTGTATKIIGIYPYDPSNQLYLTRDAGVLQPFASNLGMILFELKAIGVKNCSSSNVNSEHLTSWMEFHRLYCFRQGPNEFGQFTITDKLINSLGESWVND